MRRTLQTLSLLTLISLAALCAAHWQLTARADAALATAPTTKPADDDLAAVKAERDRLRVALRIWVAAVEERDKVINLTAGRIQKLIQERNDVIAKYNDLAKKYNTVVRELNEAKAKQ
jgi:hypothetical protein